MTQPSNNDPNRPYIIIDGKPVYVDQVGQVGQQGFGVPVQAKRREMGCWILGILFAVCLPLAIVGIVVAVVLNAVGNGLGGIPNLGEISNVIATVSSLASGPESQPITGDATHFNPLTGLDQARTFAGKGSQLISINASYVRSDGTMDLTATSYSPNTEYKFILEVPRPTDAPPVGAGGTKNGQWYQPITIEAYEPGQTRHVTSFGGGVSTSFNYTNQGLEKQVDDPTTDPSGDVIPDPTCKFTDLWKVAIKNDAPEDAVAVIEYDSEGYSFSISDISLRLRFDNQCKLIQ